MWCRNSVTARTSAPSSSRSRNGSSGSPASSTRPTRATANAATFRTVVLCSGIRTSASRRTSTTRHNHSRTRLSHAVTGRPGPDTNLLRSHCPLTSGGAQTASQLFGQRDVLVDARGVVGAAAVAEGDLAAFEVAEELGPFGVGGGPVLRGRAQRPAAGDECPVAVDHLFGVDRLVAHGGVDVAV